MSTVTNDARQINILHQDNSLSPMDTTPQVSGASHVNVSPYVNIMPHPKAIHQVYTAPIPVEDSSAIMIGAELFGGITMFSAGEKFCYPNTEQCDSTKNYNHEREDEGPAYDVSKDCITIPLDNDEVIKENDRTDTFDI